MELAMGGSVTNKAAISSIFEDMGASLICQELCGHLQGRSWKREVTELLNDSRGPSFWLWKKIIIFLFYHRTYLEWIILANLFRMSFCEVIKILIMILMNILKILEKLYFFFPEVIKNVEYHETKNITSSVWKKHSAFST